LYGFDNVGSAGPVTHFNCVEIATGKKMWEKLRFGKGNLICADGKLFMTTFKGELVLARATPEGYEELSRAAVLRSTRQAPSLADGLLYARDDREIVCFDVRAE
jgi:outer membrane protein assembly factor BamB